MTIRSINNYISALWDWSCLDSCFGNSRIRVSDLDGIVERNGRFLVIEAKSSGAPVTTGQRRMFDAMASSGLFTVIVLWGDANKPERMRVTTRHDGRVVSVERQAGIEDVRQMVTRWYRYANTFTRTNHQIDNTY